MDSMRTERCSFVNTAITIFDGYHPANCEPSLMILSCNTATARWLSAMRLTATAPGSTVIENNTVGSRSLWPSSSCHHHQSHERHSRLWFFNSVKISTMSSLLSVILIQKYSGGEKHPDWDNRCNHEWTFAFNYEWELLEIKNQN